MAGSKSGGIKARDTNIRKFGEDFYKKIGGRGGKNGHTGGFAADEVDKNGLTGRERARIAGAVGGAKSRISARKEQ